MQDLGSCLLYAVSLLTITSLSQVLGSRYHLKEQLAAALAVQAQAASTTIDALEQYLKLPSTAFIRQPVFNLLHLKADQGQMVGATSIALLTSSPSLSNLKWSISPPNIYHFFLWLIIVERRVPRPCISAPPSKAS